jgi:alkylation response protein AidB-like acyl-CoA dehydrogenase
MPLTVNVDLSETQTLVVRSAREPVAAELDREERFPKDILKGLADLGLMGVNIPAELGGAEAGWCRTRWP